MNQRDQKDEKDQKDQLNPILAKAIIHKLGSFGTPPEFGRSPSSRLFQAAVLGEIAPTTACGSGTS